MASLHIQISFGIHHSSSFCVFAKFNTVLKTLNISQVVPLDLFPSKNSMMATKRKQTAGDQHIPLKNPVSLFPPFSACADAHEQAINRPIAIQGSALFIKSNISFIKYSSSDARDITNLRSVVCIMKNSATISVKYSRSYVQLFPVYPEKLSDMSVYEFHGLCFTFRFSVAKVCPHGNRPGELCCHDFRILIF